MALTTLVELVDADQNQSVKFLEILEDVLADLGIKRLRVTEQDRKGALEQLV